MAQSSKQSAGTALITGASSGIGRDYARYLAARQYDLVLTARRASRLNDLAKELQKAFNIKVTVLVADLDKPATPAKLAADIKKKNIQIDYLVNNAGYSLVGRFSKYKWAEHAAMIQCMLTAVTELCHIYAPQMAARGHGHIVNIASAAAFLPGSAHDVLYPAIKSYVKLMSQGLYRQYRPQGVNVVATCPGYTYTEIHDVSGTREAMNRLPKFVWLQGPRVVRDSHLAVMQGRGPVIINGWVYKLIAFALSFIPGNVMTRTPRPKTTTAEIAPAAAKKPAARKTTAKKATASKAKPTKAAAKKTAPKTAKTPAKKSTKKPVKKAAKKAAKK